MKLLLLAAVARQSLSRRKFRSGLMMLGIVLGIASLTILNSIGEGTKQETMKRVRNMLGTFDTVLVRPGAGKMRGMVSVANAPPNLKFEDAAALATEVPEIRQVALLQNAFGVEAKVGDHVATPAVFGVSENWLDLRGEEIAQGAFLSQSDVRSSNRVAVLGSQAEAELFPDGNAINRRVLIGNVPFQVIGVLQSLGAGPAGGSLDNLILIPVTTASKRLFNRDFLTMIVAQLKNPEQSASAVQSISSLLHQRHHLAPSAIDDFTITDPKAVMQQLLAIGAVFNKMLSRLSVGATALGGIVIMILMLMGVSERRREIGIRRALGASRADIIKEFLLEAVLISATGGMLAIAFASAGVTVVAKTQKMPFVFSLTDLALTALLAVAAGLIFGVYPAWRAAHVDPVLALRS